MKRPTQILTDRNNLAERYMNQPTVSRNKAIRSILAQKLDQIEHFEADPKGALIAIDKMKMMGIDVDAVQIETGWRWMNDLMESEPISNTHSIVWECPRIQDGQRDGELTGFFARIPVVSVHDAAQDGRGRLRPRWKCLVGVTENEYRRGVARLQKSA